MIGNWTLYSMFLLGLLGTGHCLGMCGPLVLALPARGGRVLTHVLYHLGRVLTYSLVGALAGAVGGIGSAVAGAAGGSLGWVAHVQVVVAALAAVLLGLFGLARLGVVGEPSWMAVATPTRIPGFRWVQRNVARGGGGIAVLLFGMMLGLLPCGLSYAAFARALPAGGPVAGALLLLAFGLGTVPALLLVGTTASRFARRHARLFDVLSAMVLIGMAAALAIDAAGALL